MNAIIAAVVVVWFLWAVLFSLALCAAAAGSTPRPADLTVLPVRASAFGFEHFLN